MDGLSFLHTSDWHLGKRLFKEGRINEQLHFLSWLVEQGQKNKPDVLIISGDIFDTPIPPTEALEAYFNFLKEWTSKIPQSTVIIVAGNHDSGNFLDAPKKWLEEKKIYIYGRIAHKNVITIEKNSEKYNFHSIPYFRSNEIYKIAKEYSDFSDQKWEEDDEYALSILEKVFQQNITDGKNILVAHHAFGPFSSSQSEQAISFSGSSSIPKTIYQKGFDYLALGHIHKFQKISTNPPGYYPGSPIPFRFSESNEKFIIHGAFNSGELELNNIQIPLLKELHTLTTDEDTLNLDLTKCKARLICKDIPIFLMIKIHLSKPLHQINKEIDEIFSDTKITVLSTQLFFKGEQEEDSEATKNLYNGDINKSFEHFYKQRTGSTEVPKQIETEFKELLREITTSDTE